MIGRVPDHLNLFRRAAEIRHIAGGAGVRIHAQTLCSARIMALPGAATLPAVACGRLSLARCITMVSQGGLIIQTRKGYEEILFECRRFSH